MTQSKHTPGPWIQMGTSIGVTHGEIATVWEIDGRSFSNARLISAAPELLEALKAAQKKGSRWHPADPVVQQINAAIAKATGTTK